MDAVVSADGLRKRFDAVTALRDLTVHIAPGEIFALIGPNGAGKTTFVRTLTGTVTPTAGEVRVFDSAPKSVDRSRIGLLPQAFRPPGRLTGREIIGYYAGLYENARTPEAVLEDVGMTADADRWFERLSGGQQRRISVGTALVNDPDLLILDEPTTGIDPGGRRQLWEALRTLRRAGKTILFTTHDMAEATALSDRVGLLVEGQLISVGQPSDLVARYGGTGQVVVEPASTVSETTAEALPGRASLRDGSIVVEDVADREFITVIQALEDADIEAVRIAWEQPTLEDVFLALTDSEGPPP